MGDEVQYDLDGKFRRVPSSPTKVLTLQDVSNQYREIHTCLKDSRKVKEDYTLARQVSAKSPR